MPKGLQLLDKHVGGAELHWFECGCGHRWQGSSQRAKDLAIRLHKKCCDTGTLSNNFGGHRDMRMTSDTSFVDQQIATMEAANEVAVPGT